MEVHTAEVHPAIWMLGLWFLIVTLSGWVATRGTSRDVTLEATPKPRPEPGRLDLATERARERIWRSMGRALHALAAALSGRRARWVQRRSQRCTRRAAALELRRRRRVNAAAVLDAQARAWARTLASSHSSPSSLPPSAPRPAPALDWSEDENTRRWERTLPWGTPSPLLMRDGRAKPYPFSPLAPPLSPPAAPSSGRRSRRIP